MTVFASEAELEMQLRALRSEPLFSSVHSNAVYMLREWLRSQAVIPDGILKWLNEISETPSRRDMCFYPESAAMAEHIGFTTKAVIKGEVLDVLTPNGALML